MELWVSHDVDGPLKLRIPRTPRVFEQPRPLVEQMRTMNQGDVGRSFRWSCERLERVFGWCH